jgi:hypothetical protein
VGIHLAAQCSENSGGGRAGGRRPGILFRTRWDRIPLQQVTGRSPRVPPLPRLPPFLARLPIPLATWLAMRALGMATGAGEAELALLSLTACAVLLAVAELAPAPAAELGGGALAVTLLALALPTGAGRGAVVMAALLATLVIAAARRFRLDGARISLSAAVALTLGAQFLARGGLSVDRGLGGETALILVGLPAAAAAATVVLAQRFGWRAWLALAILVLGSGGLRGVAVATLVGLAALATAVRPNPTWQRAAAWCAVAGVATGLVLARPAHGWSLALAALALVLPARGTAIPAALAGALAAAAVLIAAYPWLRAEPASAALGMLTPARPGRQVLPEVRTLTAAEAEIEIALPPARASRFHSVSVRSHLSDSLAIAPGSPVASLILETASGERVEFVLRAGQETADWAARRSDVASFGLPTPAAWRSVAEAGFFAQEYRADFSLPQPLAIASIRLVRFPALPPEARCVVHAIELR